MFELSWTAVLHNQAILQAHNNSIHEYLSSQKGSRISFGSEFHAVEILGNILCHHPNWPNLKKILEVGSDWSLSPIVRKERLLRNQEFILRGNTKWGTCSNRHG